VSAGERVLVTGARGALGHHVARLLVDRGADVYGTRRSSLKSGPSEPPVRWLQCDLRHMGDVRAAVRESKPSRVVHAAGLAGAADLAALVEANVTALANLLAALSETKLERLVIIGSAAEYATTDSRESIREDHALAPSNEYGLSKLFQYELGRLAFRRGTPVVYARPFNVVGPGAPPATAVGDISRRLARLVHDGGSGALQVGDLNKWRDYVDVRDVANACVILLQRAAPGSTFNVCSGVPIRLAEVVEMLLAIAGKHIALHHVEHSDSVNFQVGDASGIRVLGWVPEYDLETSLRDGFTSELRQLEPSRPPAS